LGWPAWGRVDAASMIDDGVINFGGKSLSQLIHCFIDIFIDILTNYSFDKHALISKDTINARTLKL